MVRLLRAGAFALVLLMTIVVFRPFSAASTFASEPTVHRVTLRINNATTRHETTTRNVGDFLEEQGIELHPKDALRMSPDRRIEDRLVIQIDRAFYVTSIINGEEEQIKVAPRTSAGDLLSMLQADMETALLFDGDEEEILNARSRVSFTTWVSQPETTTWAIPYLVEVFNTPSLSVGVEEIRQEGIMGERRTESVVVFVGGEEYNREVIEETVIEPVTKIIDRGVGGALGTLADTSCPSFRYARQVTMHATAYTAGFSCTGKHPGHPGYRITASGREVEHGIVAVDTSVIPFGTRLYVEGYGFALAADRGSAIRGYKIDLFMECIYDARRFGRRDVTVFILD